MPAPDVSTGHIFPGGSGSVILGIGTLSFAWGPLTS